MAKYDVLNDIVIIEGEEFTQDDYESICDRADFFGMDSLTENEQYLLDVWRNRTKLQAA